MKKVLHFKFKQKTRVKRSCQIEGVPGSKLPKEIEGKNSKRLKKILLPTSIVFLKP